MKPATLSENKAMSKSVVILTGAGISKESGLDTFRDADGIWSKVRLEDVATPEAFERDPDRVHAFYNHRRAGLLESTVQPNAAHEALARLEAAWRADGSGNQVLLVTQNIDDLHERAGSSDLLHMHGELLRARCLHCSGVSPWRSDMSRQSQCPACGATGGLRVDVVWFGEMPYRMERIYEALGDCDLFLSIGTSGSVYPAAGFVEHVRRYGRPEAQTVELNLEASDGASLFHDCIHGPASEVVPAYVENLLSR